MSRQNELVMCGTTLRIVPNDDPTTDIIETVIYDHGPYNLPIEYNIYQRPTDDLHDRYSYESPHGGRYSHPSLNGARRCIAQDLVLLNIIPIPENNTHLCEDNHKKLSRIKFNRKNQEKDIPMMGDIVLINGQQHRICSLHEFSAQTCQDGSFCIFENNDCSYSGSLDEPRLIDAFELTSEKRQARFWMWDVDRRRGFGSDIYITIPVRVWTIKNVSYTSRQARKHPLYAQVKELYANSYDITSNLMDLEKSIMKGLG